MNLHICLLPANAKGAINSAKTMDPSSRINLFFRALSQLIFNLSMLLLIIYSRWCFLIELQFSKAVITKKQLVKDPTVISHGSDETFL
jgi:hypothetical protein